MYSSRMKRLFVSAAMLLVGVARAETVTYYQFRTFDLLIPAVIACAMLGGAAVFRRTRRYRPLAVLLLVLSLIPAVLMVPGVILNQVKVTPERVEQTTGPRWNPMVEGFSYADTTGVVIIGRSVDPGQEPETVWRIHGADGGISEIEPGALWSTNIEDIVARLRDYGVEVDGYSILRGPM